MRGAAAGSAAGGEGAAHLGVVALVDLAEFDPDLEYGRERAHELAEIHSARRGEVEDEFAAVEGVLGVHGLHVQSQLLRFAADDGEGVVAVGEVFRRPGVVFGGGFAHHGFQGLHDFLVGDFAVAEHDFGVLQPARGLDYGVIVFFKSYVRGIEVVHLARPAEFDADYDCHLCLTSSMEKSRLSVTDRVSTR